MLVLNLVGVAAAGGFSATTLPSTSFPMGWQNCQSAVNIWYRSDINGNAYSLSGGVQLQPVIGINLSLSTEYTATRKLTYSYPSSSFHVCGDNGTPSLASKVRTGA